MGGANDGEGGRGCFQTRMDAETQHFHHKILMALGRGLGGGGLEGKTGGERLARKTNAIPKSFPKKIGLIKHKKV